MLLPLLSTQFEQQHTQKSMYLRHVSSVALNTKNGRLPPVMVEDKSK